MTGIEKDDFSETDSEKLLKTFLPERKEKERKETPYSMKFQNPNNLKEWHTVEFYDSGFSPLLLVRHAISGERYPFHVGSHYQDLLFKVILSMGTADRPHALYYSSPQEMERHLPLQVSQKSKALWVERIARKQMSLERKALLRAFEAANAPKIEVVEPSLLYNL